MTKHECRFNVAKVARNRANNTLHNTGMKDNCPKSGKVAHQQGITTTHVDGTNAGSVTRKLESAKERVDNVTQCKGMRHQYAT
jgi:hypothetical protein